MEGNENKCTTCMEEIIDEQYYRCDSCMNKMHKNCVNLSGSETKCMPLQKRMLLLICINCRKLIAKLPYMMKVLDEIKLDIKEMKNGKTLQATIEPTKSYADILSNSTTNHNKNIKNTPTLIIKPKQAQNRETTQNDIRRNIKPAELKVGITNIRSTKHGNVIIKCATKQELDLIKNVAENSLENNYEIQTPKMRSPRIKIVGYMGNKTTEEIEDCITQQNSWINKEDKLKVTFIKKNKNKDQSTIFAECSPTLFTKMMKFNKVFIEWERYSVYEDLVITRCFNCQGFYHKNNTCNKKKVCRNCAEEHDSEVCQNIIKKCQNCVVANSMYQTKYEVNHSANDALCPSYNYHINILRTRINYDS